MRNILISLSRFQKQLVLLFFDSVALVTILLASFSIQLGYSYIPGSDFGWLVLAAPIIAVPVFAHFGLYRAVIRYIGFKALWSIVQAVSLYALLWSLIVFMASVEGIPRSVILINWLLGIVTIGGSRMLGRWILSESQNIKTTRVIIYGAGSAGRQLSIALMQSSEYSPVAFVDDNADLQRQSIHGIEVFSRNELDHLIEKKNVAEVLLAMPALSRSQRNEIIHFLEPYEVLVRSLPSVLNLAQGKVRVNDLLELDIADLLGRDSVKPNTRLLKTNISNKVVMVTGAGGSIGSELCRQIVFLKPKKLILYDISESSLYEIDQELLNIAITGVEIFPIIGSIANKDRVSHIINYFGIQTIYHAAAYKHVPIVEYNKSEGIYNNVIGTMKLAEAAISANVEVFVLISTDKAVRPTSIMGASKRIAELVLQAFAEQSNITCFTMVRFGNVLDSSGSVIPLFKRQIKEGGPITVTHADVIRYFMTIPEAAELIIQSGAMAEGGDVFVLDIGEPILIYDLAVKMIKLSGLHLLDKNNPDGDIEIQFSGLRPGEKLYEELLVEGNFSLTENRLIMRAREDMISWDKLEPVLTKIAEATSNSDEVRLIKLIHQLVPQYKPK